MFEEKVAEILLKANAVTLSPKKPYKFASGILSPVYCDNRILMSYPKERSIITNFFIKLIKNKKLKFNIIAGTATAGIPWAAFIAQRLKKPMIYVRKEAKEHGKENLIEGKLEKSACYRGFDKHRLKLDSGCQCREKRKLHCYRLPGNFHL